MRSTRLKISTLSNWKSQFITQMGRSIGFFTSINFRPERFFENKIGFLSENGIGFRRHPAPITTFGKCGYILINRISQEMIKMEMSRMDTFFS